MSNEQIRKMNELFKTIMMVADTTQRQLPPAHEVEELADREDALEEMRQKEEGY